MALEEFVLAVFGGLLAASVASFFWMHYHSQRAKQHFKKAESRIEHAAKLLADAERTIRRVKAGMRGKASVRQAEEKISAAISDLLAATSEQKAGTAVARVR